MYFLFENQTLFPRSLGQSARRRGRSAETSEIAAAVTAEFSQTLPHRKAVRKALACDFSTVFQLTKHCYSFDFTSSFLTTIKNYRSYAPRPTPRPAFLIQKIPSVVTQLPLIKPRSLLVFFTLSPTTEDTFRPCLAFTRSCPATCLRRSLPTQPYNWSPPRGVVFKKTSLCKPVPIS